MIIFVLIIAGLASWAITAVCDAGRTVEKIINDEAPR